MGSGASGRKLLSSNSSSSDSGSASEEPAVSNWLSCGADHNDTLLRKSFARLLAESENMPRESKALAYDACDGKEITAPLGNGRRKRLDARRKTYSKPKGPKQTLVCTPLNPKQFNFSKASPSQRILKLQLSTGRYDILTNKWPIFRNHMLLVARALVSQKMDFGHLVAVTEVLRACSFSAFFNSWCGGASVNHFHAQLIDEVPPVARLPLAPGVLVQGHRCRAPIGYPGTCYVFDGRDQLPIVDVAIRVMQAKNQPHNILFTPARENLSPLIYIFPKPHVTPARSLELYASKVGASEVIGCFTTYTKNDFDKLSPEHADELVQINTAKLPVALLRV